MRTTSGQRRQPEEHRPKGFHTGVATPGTTPTLSVHAPPLKHHGDEPRAHGEAYEQPERGRELLYGRVRNVETCQLVPQGLLELDVYEATSQSHSEQEGQEGEGEGGQEGGPEDVHPLHHVAAHRGGEGGEEGGEGGAGAQAALELGAGGGLVGIEHLVGLNGGLSHWRGR